MIALLVSTGAAFVLCILSTPTPHPRAAREGGWGGRHHDDGPFAHPHEKKAGTATMGGIAIVVSAVIGYLVAHISTKQTKFARTGLTLMAMVIEAMAVVGFVDDYLGVRSGRNLGLRKRGKTGGQLVVAVGFAIPSRSSGSTSPPTCRSHTWSTSTSVGSCGSSSPSSGCTASRTP